MRHCISHVHACGKLSTIRPGHNQCGLLMLPVQRYIETSYQEYALTQSRLIQLQILHRRICLAKVHQYSIAIIVAINIVHSNYV